MSDNPNKGYDPMTGEEEPQGPEQYLRPGEELLVYTPDIQIKKFRFDAYLTNARLFLTDQDEKNPGVTAKEIPIGSVADTNLEHSPSQEPILVISIRTSDDDLRTMKMVFVHTGTDRLSQAEEWMHLIRHGRQKSAPQIGGDQGQPEPVIKSISPEARALSETMVFPEPTRAESPVPLSSREPLVPPKTENPRSPSPISPARLPENHQAIKSPQDATTTQIQFCFHCGHRLPPNANFCPYCGTRMGQPNSSPARVPAPVQPRKEVTGPERPPEKQKKSRLPWPFKKK